MQLGTIFIHPTLGENELIAISDEKVTQKINGERRDGYIMTTRFAGDKGTNRRDDDGNSLLIFHDYYASKMEVK